MEVKLNILIEVTTIITKFISIQNKRVIRDKKRIIFIADIQSIEEGLVLNRNKTDFNDCVNIIMNSGEVIKTNEDYTELVNVMYSFWEREQQIAKQEDEAPDC